MKIAARELERSHTTETVHNSLEQLTIDIPTIFLDYVFFATHLRASSLTPSATGTLACASSGACAAVGSGATTAAAARWGGSRGSGTRGRRRGSGLRAISHPALFAAGAAPDRSAGESAAAFGVLGGIAGGAHVARIVLSADELLHDVRRRISSLLCGGGSVPAYC